MILETSTGILQVAGLCSGRSSPCTQGRRDHKRETRERERQEFCWPSAICHGVIMRIKFQNCSRLDTGEVIETKEVRLADLLAGRVVLGALGE